MRMVLYVVADRRLTAPSWIDVPDDVRDFDSWLHRSGYGRSHTLRRGIVREATQAEIAALGKPSAPLPGYRPNFRALAK